MTPEELPPAKLPFPITRTVPEPAEFRAETHIDHAGEGMSRAGE